MRLKSQLDETAAIRTGVAKNFRGVIDLKQSSLPKRLHHLLRVRRGKGMEGKKDSQRRALALGIPNPSPRGDIHCILNDNVFLHRN